MTVLSSPGILAVEERDWNPSVKAGWFAMADAPPRDRPPPLPGEQIAGLAPLERHRSDQARAIWHAARAVDPVAMPSSTTTATRPASGRRARPAR